MGLLDVPTETLAQCTAYLDKESDIYALARVCTRLHDVAINILYDFNIQNHNSRALFWAAKHGHENLARKILSRIPNPNSVTNYTDRHDQWKDPGLNIVGDFTPLHIAASEGHVPVVKLLSNSGTCPHCQFEVLDEQYFPYKSDQHKPYIYSTPLHLASKDGDVAIVKLLLQIKAEPEVRTLGGAAPLYHAVGAKNERVVRLIARRVTNVGSKFVHSGHYVTPLHLACMNLRWDSARYFLERGADVNQIDNNGNTPLQNTFNSTTHVDDPKGLYMTVKILLQFGADPKLGNCGVCWIGVNHHLDSIRTLFKDYAKEYTQKPKEPPVQIGRGWMTAPEIPKLPDIEIEELCNPRPIPQMLSLFDGNEFPPLGA
ncbi:uncharacterized protein KY384_005733 [Bacidia gigantensis]|uniref:uncharacterized protein n=1 Tax=Bacidia gigantensis TaxID=2732470 RepID=UPI001D05AF45|nr:uncharacterized protein KY384_005733 [Bacidia gigantensis]KAG8529098.1 hypothetical protein KY384_005733 [Bacidia gigantensis]